MPYGAFCCLLYPIGIPIFYAGLLIGARKDLNPTDKCDLLDDGPAEFREARLEKMNSNARDLLIRRDTYQNLLIEARNERLSHEKEDDLNIPISSFRFLWRDYEPRK